MHLDACSIAPDSWRRLAIKDICRKVTSGGTPSRKRPEFYADGNICWVKTKELNDAFIIDTEEKITTDAVQSSSAKVLPAGTILLAMYGATVGMLGILSKEMACNQACCALIVDEEFDRDYLYYQLLAHRSQLESLATGAAQQNLSGQQIKELILPFPAKEEQNLIGKFLRSLDDRIALLRETNKTLEEIAQAIFKSWFIDFDPVREKMKGRLPLGLNEEASALFPDELVESELGLVPKGWVPSTVGEVCTYLSRGISPKYADTDGVLVLNQKCIRDFEVDFSKGRRHDSNQRKVDGRLLEVGDILVNSTGVGTLGRVAQILGLNEPAIVDSHVTVVRASETITWTYLGEYMKKMQPTIESMGEGSTGQTELSRSKLAELKILIPPQNVTQLFDSIVKPLKKRIFTNQESAFTLSDLRNTLLPRLVSGRLDRSKFDEGAL